MPIKDLIECKQRLCDVELGKQYEKVFQLFDIHGSGLVSKSEVAFNLLQIKDIVSAELDLSLIPNFEEFQSSQREIDVKYFRGLI